MVRPKINNNLLVLGASALFVLMHLALLYLKGIQLLVVVPFVIIVAMIALNRIDLFYLLTVFSVPLSIPLFEFRPDLSYSVTLPSELFIVTVMVLLGIKSIREGGIGRDFLLHPVSLAIYLNIAWLLITSATSTMPVVSFKFLASRIWFLAAFYFLAGLLFSNPENFKRFNWAHVIALAIVIVYTITRHIGRGLFDPNAAHQVMWPFYRDHTSYGAVLAFVLPIFIGFLFMKHSNSWVRLVLIGLVPLLLVALILSYSRAAWMGLIVALAVYVVVTFRIKLWVISLGVAIIFTFIALNWTEINYSMQSNSTDSSANLAEHVQSISNISNDYSNVERLNRWNCAVQMFREKPIFGWGPGTYMFQYAPFQLSYLVTPISTFAGDRGNAHSEYLGPLSESGFLGTITFLIIAIAFLRTGFRAYRLSSDRNQRILLICSILGVITYLVHGVLNNFLDTAKISVLFWGFIAFIVATDIKIKSEQKPVDKA